MEENKNNNILKNIMIIIITALITTILTTIVVYNVATTPKGLQSNNPLGNIYNGIVKTITGNKNTNQTLDEKTNDIKLKLEEIYMGDINEEKLIEGALEGYVSALGDEYTEYLTKDEVTELMQEVNGSYVGVGLYISQNLVTNEIVVVGIIEGSPAEKNGILIGDIIKKVDGIEYTGEQLTTASNCMKGVEGTNVKITVVRDGKEIELDIVREKIKFQCIKSEKLENDIGYIKITSFDGGVAADFQNAFNNLQKQGIKSLIIDLRNNGGGLVEESLKIAETIVPKGNTTLVVKDKKSNEEIYKSSKDPIIKMPIVILVNEYTASASEILTAAIKENVDVKVVGMNTYGKGVIQGIFLFDDQETGLKITIQEYFTPKHNKIHKVGIKPDIEIQLPEEWQGYSNIEREFDNQLNKAIEILK